MAILPDHSFNAFSAGRSGRPRKVELTEEQKKELAALYLATNATRKSGSMTLAWSIFCQPTPGTWMGCRSQIQQAHHSSSGAGCYETCPAHGWIPSWRRTQIKGISLFPRTPPPQPGRRTAASRTTRVLGRRHH